MVSTELNVVLLIEVFTKSYIIQDKILELDIITWFFRQYVNS